MTFIPGQSDSPYALLTINDNAFAGPHVVGIYGTSLNPPAVSFFPLQGNQLTFGGTAPGSTLGPVSVNLTNSGQVPLIINGIALAGGDFAETNNCVTTLSPSATCAITVTFTPTATGNRTGTIILTDNAPDSPQHLQLSGTGEDFALSTSGAAVAISPGQQAKWTLTVTPEGGLTGPVSLACTGAPQLASCALSSNSITLDGTTAATVNVTVTTTASSRLAPWRGWRWPSGLALWLVVLILLLTAAARGQKHRLRWAGIAVLLLVAIVIASCGGGGGFGGGGGGPTHNPGTPAGTYSLTLTATGTALAETGIVNVVHSTTLTLTVQ